MYQTGSLPQMRKTSGATAAHQSLKDQDGKEMSYELFFEASALRARGRVNKFLNFSLVLGLRN